MTRYEKLTIIVHHFDARREKLGVMYDKDSQCFINIPMTELEKRIRVEWLRLDYAMRPLRK